MKVKKSLSKAQQKYIYCMGYPIWIEHGEQVVLLQVVQPGPSCLSFAAKYSINIFMNLEDFHRREIPKRTKICLQEIVLVHCHSFKIVYSNVHAFPLY